MVSRDQLDCVREDAHDERPKVEDGDKTENSTREQVDFAVTAVGVYRLARLGREQPEGDLTQDYLRIGVL